MYFFVNQGRNVLITKSILGTDKMVFSLRDPNTNDVLAGFNALAIATTVTPKPAIQIHGSVGGLSYINVFGEDPLLINIRGMVAGSDCTRALNAESALGVSLSLFASLGVVGQPMPLIYTIGRMRARAAYLVAMTVSQDDSFMDLASFDMQLLAEPLAEIGTPKPVAIGGGAGGGGGGGLQVVDVVGKLPTGRAILSAAVRDTISSSLIARASGEPLSEVSIGLVVNGYASPGAGNNAGS